MTQDKDLQEIYCAWANQRFPDLAPITEVKFEEENDPDYSELTPGMGDYLEVTVKTEKGWRPVYAIFQYDLVDTINEITTFAANYSKEVHHSKDNG